MKLTRTRAEMLRHHESMARSQREWAETYRQYQARNARNPDGGIYKMHTVCMERCLTDAAYHEAQAAALRAELGLLAPTP